ncbi:MBL fold metallo-hydrolase [Paenibacillaceae bacterium WGS1546]|uniref:MBL fold metallo-hydrolase n=1 Tax=Cohnella sp. WGS1546 TaxID=3366810 RepID=UPI00372D4283
MIRLSERLYVFRDTCNVYAIVDGTEATLIDFGDGGVLDELHRIGVSRVAGVLMTHHHRDQGQGLPKAAAAGIPILVPHAEQDLFARVDEHWQAREIRNNYNTRQDRFSLLESVPVAGTLKDYATVRAGRYPLLVLPTPGHTTGSISLLGDIDGRKVAFTGDLIAAPGKVWSLSATQWTYNGAEGVPASVASLLDLKDRELDRLLPSHGDPIDEPREAIDLLTERFVRLLRCRQHNPRLLELREQPYERVLPHLLKSRASMSNYYVLLADSGKALFIDFGYDFLTGIPAGADRASRRPWLYSIGKLKSQYGVRSVDAVLLTHYHDDHVAGCNLLRDVEGAEVWAAANFADVLERPADYDLPCLWYDPIPVDRVVPLREPIRWEGYEITLHEQPGHTLYAVAIAFEADGKKVLAIGDQYQGDEGLLWNYVYQNRFQYEDYVRSAALYEALRPDVIVSGHWDPVWVEAGYWKRLKESGRMLARLHRELLPTDEADFGAEGFAVRISPYRIDAEAGTAFDVRVEALNPLPDEDDVLVRLALPAGWVAAPPEQALRLPSGGRTVVSFSVGVPERTEGRRIRIAADVTAGSRRLGQQAEALVTIITKSEE